ncbi:hypothetical protein [Alicyclobacillus contaminans]|uniref:hypothetical protein n=1 Tax=Alicyclobacillus contaminans TaxID=392016 RepID=UPI000558251D|nr:hypothetical protein [Alicyclobacillus contaminans]
MNESLWKAALETVPDAEIVRLINSFHIPVNGFGTKVSLNSVRSARKMIEAQLKTPKKLLKMRQIFRDMKDKKERLQTYPDKSVDELWELIEDHKRECLPIWILLAHETNEAEEKAWQLIERLKSATESALQEQTQQGPTDQTSNGSMEDATQELERKVAELQEELNSVRQQLRRAKRDLETQANRTENNLRTVREQRDQYKAQVQKLEKENKELQEALSQSEQAALQLGQDLKKAKAQLAERQDELNRALEENARLKAELESLSGAMAHVPQVAAGTEEMEPTVRNVAVIGDIPSMSIQNPPGCRVIPFATSNVSTFFEQYDMETWDEVWMIDFAVTNRVKSRLRKEIPGHKLKVFENVQDLQQYVLSN